MEPKEMDMAHYRPYMGWTGICFLKPCEASNKVIAQQLS